MTFALLPGVRFAPAARRARLLGAYEVDLVIDVGANRGQYATAHGFSPIAFEGVLDDPDTGEMLQADAIFRAARS